MALNYRRLEKLSYYVFGQILTHIPLYHFGRMYFNYRISQCITVGQHDGTFEGYCKGLTVDCMTGNCRKIQAIFDHAILCPAMCFVLKLIYPVIQLFCIELILELKYPALMCIMEFDNLAKEGTGNPH